MKEEFKDQIYKEISYRHVKSIGNVIKSNDVKIIDRVKIAVEEESFDGVKIILKKDSKDNIKEIKFVCTCGETKSVLLDYSDE